MRHQVLTAVLLLMIPALSLLAQDSKPLPGVHDVLMDRYGASVEWTVKGDVITYWKPVVVKGQTRAPSILKPTPSQITTWIQEAIQAEANAPAVYVPDQHWRALIAAMCVMTECENESAAWKAFLSALP